MEPKIYENPEEEREQERKLDRIEPPFTPEQIREAVPFAVQLLSMRSYYSPLIERFPILVDEHVPKYQQQLIRDNDSCACTDANNVYVMTDEMAKRLNQIFDAIKKEGKQGTTNTNIIVNVAAILAHEYTHILCQHKKIGNNLGKITKAEAHCFLLACEVEANRGHMVNFTYKDYDQDKTLVYRGSITDDEIPETKKDKYLPQIYATILRMYNDKRKMLEQLLQQIINNDLFDAIGQGQGQKGNKDGKGDKNKVQGKSQTDENNGDMDGESSANGSVKRQQKDGEDDDGDETEATWEKLTQEKIEESIKNAQQVVEQAQTQETGSEDGFGLESPYVEYKPELTPQENLQRNYERWHEKQIKRELRKMKGLIRGNISTNKEKTYARPSRRPITGSGGLIRKGVRYEKSYSPKVLIAMDSSGSMCSTTMKEVACAIENVFKDLGKPKQGSYICKHESNVSDVKPMRQWKEVVESYRPCGGNCFLHVLETANKLGVDVVLNVGDGQDCIYRDYQSGATKEVNKFNTSGRKWFDVLITDKNENKYYRQEQYYDKEHGIEREGIYLGDKISKYLGKKS